MSDFLQRHATIILIGAAVLYVLSLGFWLMWAGALLLGAGYGSLLLTLFAGITALLYPIIIVGSLLMGWRFQRHNQAKKALMAAIAPFLYIPVMIIIGLIALFEGT